MYNIDPAWCDCPDGYPNIGIGKYKHLPSCRYGIIEDYLYSIEISENQLEKILNEKESDDSTNIR